MNNILPDQSIVEADAAFYSRALKTEHYSGDVAYISQSGNKTFIAVVDAAGHGRKAHFIACEMEKIFKTRDTDDLAALIEFSHQQLQGGLGAVIIAGSFDAETLEFTFVHVGDTHGKIIGSNQRSLVGQPGMLGHAIRTPIVKIEKLLPGDTLILCSDGITERFNVGDVSRHRTKPTSVLARRIVDLFGKDHDDATCLVLRCI
jgi:negative regulator of sigma-B (phosphoserine phosphatase)